MPSVHKNLPPVIRLAHPLAFAAFLNHVGAPVEGYFRRQGLPALCKDPNAFVPLKKAWALFDDAAQREGLAVGWHVGRYIGDHNLNAGLLLKLEEAPTLYRALHRMARLVNSEASHLRLGIKEERHCILFYTTGYSAMTNEPGFSSSQAYQLEVYLDLLRHFIGKSWVPEEIGITAATVPAVVEEHFPDCRIRFNRPFSYLAVPRSCLHLSVRTRRVESSGADPLLLTDKLNFADMLSLVLKPYLSQGYPSLRFAASLTGTSVRTLARRLSECGKSTSPKSMKHDSMWPGNFCGARTHPSAVLPDPQDSVTRQIFRVCFARLAVSAQGTFARRRKVKRE
jgi:hypothetical protein